MSSVSDTLDVAKTILAGLSNGTTTLQAVYIYPDDYANVDMTNLPVMIVSQVKGINEQLGDIGNRGVRGYDRWTMEWLLYLSRGEHRRPSQAAADAELLERGWRRAINNLVARERYSSKSARTIWEIGTSSGGEHTHIETFADHDYWNEEPFWTRLFHIQIMQIYDR